MAKQTVPEPIPDPKSPKTICGYLSDLVFTGEAYGENKYGGYRCASEKIIRPASAGRLVRMSYDASGDNATTVKTLMLTLDCDGREDADKADDFMINASDQLWQKVFGKPLPEEFKSTLSANKGKKGPAKKNLTEPVYATVTREPWPGGTGYKLETYLKMPD